MMSTEEKEVWVHVYSAVIGRLAAYSDAHIKAEEHALKALVAFRRTFADKAVGYRDNAK